MGKYGTVFNALYFHFRFLCWVTASIFPCRAQRSVTRIKSLLLFLSSVKVKKSLFTNLTKQLFPGRNDMASVDIRLESKKQVSPAASASITELLAVLQRLTEPRCWTWTGELVSHVGFDQQTHSRAPLSFYVLLHGLLGSVFANYHYY